MPHQMPVHSAADARARLEAGNETFRRLADDGSEHVLAAYPIAASLDGERRGVCPKHEPFAAVVGCSDARVPVEFIFGQAANDLFVVRVAGNVLASGVTGSVQYAVGNIDTIKIIVVLGHTNCGGLTAAVDALLTPETYLSLVHSAELRSIVDSLLAGVRMAVVAMESVHGPDVANHPDYRRALIDVSAIANAAISANVLNHSIETEVVFGLFDLDTRTVGIAHGDGWESGLADPPSDDRALVALLRNQARWALDSEAAPGTAKALS